MKSISGSASEDAWDVYPGSEFFHPGSKVKKIPDPGSGSASKYRSIFIPINCFSEICSGMLILDPDLDFLPNPDPGVKKAPGPGSATMPSGLLRYLTNKKKDFKAGLNLRRPNSPPPPLRFAKAGRNHLIWEINPLLSTGIGERFSQNI